MKRLILTEEEKNRILGLHGSNLLIERANTKVSQIQTFLKGKGHNLGNSGPNKDGVDGVWGKRTRDAVKTEFGIDIDETGNVMKSDLAGTQQAPAGTTPAGTTPAGTTPVGTTPAGTTPAGTTPAGTQQPAGAASGGDIVSFG